MSARYGLAEIGDSKLSRDLYIEITSAYDLLLNRYGITEYAALYEALAEREDMEIKEWKKFDGVSHGSVIYKGDRFLFRLKNGIELATVNLGCEVVEWYDSPVLETERKKRYESRGLKYESGWEKILGELLSFDERIRIDEGFLDTLEKEWEERENHTFLAKERLQPAGKDF